MLEFSKIRGESNSPQRLIAAILLVLSFIMLFLPWVSMSVKINGKNYTLKDVYHVIAYNEGESDAEARNEILRGIRDLADEIVDGLQEEGIKVSVDSQGAVRLVSGIEDGKITTNELAHITSYLFSLAKSANNYIKTLPIDELYIPQIRAFQTMEKSSEAILIVLWLGMIAAMASFVLAGYSVKRGKGQGMIPYATVCAIMLIAMAISANRVNSEIRGTVNVLLGNIGLLYGSESITSFFHVTAWPIVATLFAVCGAVAVMLPTFEDMKIKAPSIPKIGGWKCVGCGNQCSDSSRFCPNCGEKKPTPIRCPSCGWAVKAGDRFCLNCGTPLQSELRKITPTEPAEPPKTTLDTTPIQIKMLRACPHCGAKLGSELKGSLTICPNCGQLVSK